MNPNNYIEFLQKLILMALEYQANPQFGSKNFEPAFFAVLMFVKGANPDLQAQAELEFVKIIQSPNIKTYELVAYCMRDLKFKQVREATQNLINQTENKGRGFQIRRRLENVLQAYDFQW